MWAQVRGLKEWSAARYVLLGEDVRADKVGDAFCLVTPHPQVRPKAADNWVSVWE